jgi:hypothetical protein
MPIAVICLLILLAILSKTKIEIYYIENKFKLKFIFFEVIKIKFKAKTKKVKEEAKDRLDLKVLSEMVCHNLYFVRYVLSKMELSINMDCTFSIYSPDKTAIIYGVINSLIYSLHTLLYCEAKKYKGIYKLKPDFNNKQESINIMVTMEDRIGIRNFRIIIIACKMLPMLLVYKKKVKIRRRKLNESSDRRTNENYNG